ncbi:TonB-dependent receptor plug domain-containing protein [Aliikangiella maris]|uniref:Uncharacterized protein n=2 Tax=Aliikangiella maris TaxID=3162458 RepID=A0ABV3MQ81_9GAMM
MQIVLKKNNLFKVGYCLLLPVVSLLLSGKSNKVMAAVQTQNELVQLAEETYLPDFFTSYAPQTALDMVMRLPGFELKLDDDAVRGFGATAGNVLIDGIRPPSKSGGIKNALLRIPASQVAKIIVVRGATSTGDAAGQSVIANIYRVNNQSVKRWQLGVGKTSGEQAINPQMEFNGSKPIANWQSAFKLNAIKEQLPRDATTETFDQSMSLVEKQAEKRPSELNEVFISGDASRTIDKNSWQLTAQLGWSQFIPETKRWIDRLPANNQPSESQYTNNYRDSQYYTGEVGVDWSHQYADWTFRLLGLANWQNWFVDAFSATEIPAGVFDSGNQLRFDEHKRESVVRTVWQHADKQGPTSEYGIEVAYNRMTSQLKLDAINETFTPINRLRNTDAFVEEFRGEGFVNYTWSLDAMVIKAGLATEFSSISVSGDARHQQNLHFWKPSFAINYNATPTLQYRFNLEHSVGQLDFSDFAASADLVEERQISGNEKLQPDQKTRLSVSLDYRFAEKGAFSFEIYHNWHKDVLEQILLTPEIQALGNAGSGQSWGAKMTSNLPLERWIPGGALELNADWMDSSFDDPITGQTRVLTDFISPDIVIDFRQDLSVLRWGIGYTAYKVYRDYYADEFDYLKNKPMWFAFAEKSFGQNLTLRLEIENVNDFRQYRERKRYSGNRADSAYWLEKTQRERGETIKLLISGEF